MKSEATEPTLHIRMECLINEFLMMVYFSFCNGIFLVFLFRIFMTLWPILLHIDTGHWGNTNKGYSTLTLL